MDVRKDSELAKATGPRSSVERKSEREIVITRTVNGPARLVFEAFTKPELFKRWWTPRSLGMSFATCEMDVRVGGRYSFTFNCKGQDAPSPAFTGSYVEITPTTRIVWTSDEAGEDAQSITTATLEEKAGKTLVTFSEVHPSKEAADAAFASGAAQCTCESFDQLEELVVSIAKA